VISARPDLRSIKLELALPAYAIKSQKVPRYYFVGRTADHSHDDPHGVADHHAARAYAHRIVQELKEGGYHPSGPTTLSEIEAGNTLHSIPF